MDSLPVIVANDRRCRGWTLDNRLRRWWAPAEDEVRLLDVIPGQRVVDLGAGVGYLVPELLASVGTSGSVELVDPDSHNLARAQERWGRDARVRFHVGSATHVASVADSAADRVVLSLVLCCMIDKGGALDETWRMLRPGGIVLVTYPERGRRLSPHKQSLRVTPETWARLLSLHPWRVASSEKRRWIRRHVLQKPGG